MNTILVIALTVGLASADISLTYKVPETSYGVPSYQYNNNADYNTGYTGGAGYNYKAPNSAKAGYQGSTFGQQNTGYQPGYNYISSLGANNGVGYQTGNYQTNSAAGNQNYQGLNNGDNTASQPSYQSSGAASQGGYQTFNQYQTSSQYQASTEQKYQQHYNQWQQQPAQVFKHFYVHAAPEEAEKPKIRQPVVLPPPQKHYKIIFIKAPSQTVYTPQYIPVPQPNEEKTIVYVLVKKPDEHQQEVVVPHLPPKTPAKPEVYFIKYNKKADTQAVINNIVNDHKGSSVNYVSGAGGSGQYNDQYSTGQASQDAAGQYQGALNQYAQTQSDNQASTAGFGTQSFSSASSQAVPVGPSVTTGGYDSASSTGYTTAGTTGNAAATLNIDNLNSISTSQGIPQESYGPPKFRV